jgi:hypothetical protein
MKHTGTFNVRTLNPGDLYLTRFHWRRVIRVRPIPDGADVEILHGRPLDSGDLQYTHQLFNA